MASSVIERPARVEAGVDVTSLPHDRYLDHALVVDQLYKTFRDTKRLTWLGRKTPAKSVHAVDNVSLHIRPGEIYGVLGSNGSGKSTLIRMISTLLLPDAGSITVFGHDVVAQESTVKRMLNRVSVDAAFFKKLSPMENLMYAARLYDVDPRDARDEIVRILNTLGITTERIYQPLEKMSRGMQQKVAIARALLTSPILLLLDEPTTGLDPRSKRDVQEFVLKVREEHNATIVLTSHDMDEADRLCDRIAFIDGGQLVREDTPLGFKEDYARRHGMGETLPSLEDVFLEVVGRSFDDDDNE